MGYNLEITRPNDKKTEKKFKLWRWRPVLLEKENASWRCRGGGQKKTSIGAYRESQAHWAKKAISCDEFTSTSCRLYGRDSHEHFRCFHRNIVRLRTLKGRRASGVRNSCAIGTSKLRFSPSGSQGRREEAHVSPITSYIRTATGRTTLPHILRGGGGLGEASCFSEATPGTINVAESSLLRIKPVK
ncbi:hypothetical protein PUN28_002001 [Cardiocondyla obscurior]|uniref:Uncharacterized protein n=1 Tax=Cardiocondyla obscurior TaxID=286306 RepID=A0AAW2GS19_9HYME